MMALLSVIDGLACAVIAWVCGALLLSAHGNRARAIAVNFGLLMLTVGTVALFIALLEPLGWVLAGAFLFWGVSIGLGGRRYVFDAAVALLVSSAVQLVFSGGLGLTLPGGILAAVF